MTRIYVTVLLMLNFVPVMASELPIVVTHNSSVSDESSSESPATVSSDEQSDNSAAESQRAPVISLVIAALNSLFGDQQVKEACLVDVGDWVRETEAKDARKKKEARRRALEKKRRSQPKVKKD